MSILFSIIRLIPYMMKMRFYACMSAVLFGLMWAALLILKISVCETDTRWKNLPGAQCVLGPAVAGVELGSEYIFYLRNITRSLGRNMRTADFTADIILIIMPIRLLWRIKLSPSRRALLTGIFSASIFTTITSIVHGVYVLSDNRNAEGIWAHVEVRLSRFSRSSHGGLTGPSVYRHPPQ